MGGKGLINGCRLSRYTYMYVAGNGSMYRKVVFKLSFCLYHKKVSYVDGI